MSDSGLFEFLSFVFGENQNLGFFPFSNLFFSTAQDIFVILWYLYWTLELCGFHWFPLFVCEKNEIFPVVFTTTLTMGCTIHKIKPLTIFKNIEFKGTKFHFFDSYNYWYLLISFSSSGEAFFFLIERRPYTLHVPALLCQSECYTFAYHSREKNSLFVEFNYRNDD